MFKYISLVIALLTFMVTTAVAQTPMTNQGVIDLVKAKMSTDIVLAAIRGSSPDFDTSSAGIIALNSAGVPEVVIQEIIQISSGRNGNNSEIRTAIINGINPEEVILIDDGVSKPMQYLTPQIRTAARALGLGGVAQYAALRGTAAVLRTSNQPRFQIAVPNNAQPDSYFTLANFAVRRNGTREVLIGGGYMSFSSGITKDRVVAVTSHKTADQSNAPENFTIYELTPTSPLPSGEYAVVLYSSQVRSTGYFSTGLDSYFDFGVN